MKAELKKLKFKNFIFLTIAGIINSFGVMLFLFPVQLFDSGISGLSMLLDQVTPPYLTISIFLLVLNIPIFIFGYKKEGINFTIYSLYTIAIYSLFSFLISDVWHIDSFIPIIEGENADEIANLILYAIFGGVISGIGSGLTIRYGGAIDGLDVLSVIFAKKIGISIGTFVLIFDIILYLVCGIVNHSWIKPLYSIIAYFIGSRTVDFVVEGINKSKCAMIITDKPDEVTNELSTNFKSAGTISEAKGGYSKEDKAIIYFVVNQFQINKLKETVKSIDEDAFVFIMEVSEIFKTENK